ncbi:hypothetical protein MexAM1_META1p0097 [Methylorubrum extorquens AM1]|uniref:Uncharacterized protein n=1 Tax=Methylorubrum extorquens (strain ATCC 14718 / DSM 1338 / JCM 2805 / NCIMB 9133 / AM1) TaxID=272630 RepID=C5APC8_METEA|nr:hypothetical protein MexAM1_META1p0097 [Methylorubrum extorquens AM1]
MRQGFDLSRGLGAVIRSDNNPFAIGDCITLQGGAVCRNPSYGGPHNGRLPVLRSAFPPSFGTRKRNRAS